MDIENWALIRHLYKAEKLSISAIAAQLGLDRKTVRKALREESFLQRQKRKKRASLLDPFRKQIQTLLDAHPSLSAVRILEEIRKKGYEGQLTILRDYLQTLRRCRQEPYLRLHLPAGMQAQADWAHCGHIRIGSIQRPLYCFVLVLSFSRALHLEFTLSMSMEVFLEAHVRGLRYFQGCPREILYDNLKSVVLSRIGGHIRFNPRFLDFAGFFGFKPRACNIRKAREKGRVEMGVQYIKRNFLSGRIFGSFQDLRHQALCWRDEIANVRIHATTRKRPIDLLQEDRARMLPLPEKDYDTASRLTMICPPDAFLHFQTNLYSVPFSCVGKQLLLKADMRHIRIFEGLKQVAEHRRCYDRHQLIENSSHRKALLAQRQRASFSKAFEELCRLGPECKTYLEGLNQCEIQLKRHVMRLLRLCRIYGITEFRQAVSHALAFKAFGADYIERIIVNQRRQRYAKIPTGAVQIPSRPEFSLLDILPHSLESYECAEEANREESRSDKKKGGIE